MILYQLNIYEKALIQRTKYKEKRVIHVIFLQEIKFVILYLQFSIEKGFH